MEFPVTIYDAPKWYVFKGMSNTKALQQCFNL